MTATHFYNHQRCNTFNAGNICDATGTSDGKTCSLVLFCKYNVVKIRSSSCKNESSYIAQYPVLRTVQSVLHFTSLTDLFTQTPSRLLWEASSLMLQLMHEGCSYTYSPLSIARYSFIQLTELEQCRVKKLVQDFNTGAQYSNPGSRSREPETLPLSHCKGLLLNYCVLCRLCPSMTPADLVFGSL